VEHERVAVRVREVGHVADAAVDRVGGELDALRLELCARGRDVRDAQRHVVGVGCEGQSQPLGLPNAERYLARGNFEPGRRLLFERQAKRFNEKCRARSQSLVGIEMKSTRSTLMPTRFLLRSPRPPQSTRATPYIVLVPRERALACLRSNDDVGAGAQHFGVSIEPSDGA
jgi:hypothetical protein